VVVTMRVTSMQSDPHDLARSRREAEAIARRAA
jgi:hypothetical protein